MGANFLFDGSAESKEQLKLFLLYSDEGFKVSPPVYLRRFFDASSGAEIGNLRDLREYERQLDRAIAFVRENTLSLPAGRRRSAAVPAKSPDTSGRARRGPAPRSRRVRTALHTRTSSTRTSSTFSRPS